MPLESASLTWRIRDRELDLSGRPLIMGILNVTPDSFSDGGRFSTTEQAVAQGLQLVEEGADILDIGGESTRPGAEPVPVDEECRRVVPVVEELVKRTTVALSIDTSKAEVARRCLDLGAHIVNDVTALRGDPDLMSVVAASGAGLVLMHMLGTPKTMQQGPHYDDVIGDLATFFLERLLAVEGAGIAHAQVLLDPGIGFGKTGEHNLEILARLSELHCLGRPVCLGVSRKGFLGKALNRPLEQRLAGALAVACVTTWEGSAQVFRVHDVAPTRDVLVLLQTLRQYRR